MAAAVRDDVCNSINIIILLVCLWQSMSDTCYKDDKEKCHVLYNTKFWQ